jgi:hypothetical protein
MIRPTTPMKLMKKLQKQLKEANHQLQAYKGRGKKVGAEEGHGAVNQEQGTM